VATQEAVPAALALAALHPGDTWAAARYAASLGGDCDTIAAMTGAVVGAHAGRASVPPRILRRLSGANPGLALDRLAGELLALRLAPVTVEDPRG
jgi:ADP-ribosylglycohydrolase